ncbi:MBL fold metallo-hydrolase, partial [Neisseria cinerea]|uniref:MBL fold metallo-hydrolase n=1 Tax=Neisseria cinerea TaxID=483 RepID=UPI002B1D8F01
MCPVNPPRQHCPQVWDEESGEAVLTDVGGEVPFLLQELANRKLTLTAIWLTNGHLDHAGGVVEMLKTRNVPVLGPHPDDEFLLQSLPQTTAQYGFPVPPAFAPTRWLEEGETPTVGPYASQVLHLPGHTRGHCAFYCAVADFLM